jgi:hypothetical protein
MKDLKNIPNRIFLVIGEEDDIKDLKDFKSLDYEYVLWSEDRINSTDIEYILDKENKMHAIKFGVFILMNNFDKTLTIEKIYDRFINPIK